jgi:tRNA-Thr(GGU) m(6)t(6)A37 methyltransferase TsaA
VEIEAKFAKCVEGIASGDEIILITWLHEGRRSVLKVHPGADKKNALMGVFATRSPDRPNPLGLHRVKVLEIKGLRWKVGPVEAIDGTPVVDIKPVLAKKCDS